jgi:hypothetical protein
MPRVRMYRTKEEVEAGDESIKTYMQGPGGPRLLADQVEWCRGFVIETALRLQSLDF